LEFTNGLENRFIKGNFGMTIDKVLENIIDWQGKKSNRSWFIKERGIEDRSVMIKLKKRR
jgi:hypothetical protein